MLASLEEQMEALRHFQERQPMNATARRMPGFCALVCRVSAFARTSRADFSDVTPVRGVIMGGGQHAVQVAVDVEPVDVAG